MNTYKYTVTLSVEVDAFDDSDAWDALQDAFGIGDQMGLRVLDCEYKEVRNTRGKRPANS